jgi:DNA repair protein RecN (Recombination protein N)
MEALEAELEKLNHAEEIKTGLSTAEVLLQGETNAALQQLKDCLVSLSRITHYLPESAELIQRLESAYIEIKDVAQELDALNFKVLIDPERLNVVRERLDLLYSLLQKHHMNDVTDLIQLKKDLEEKISEISTYDERLEHVKAELDKEKEVLADLASRLSGERRKALRPVEETVTRMLHEMAIPNATFRIVLENENVFNTSGKDSIQFLFSANKHGGLQEISKVASGGELSRLMLSIKSLMSDSTQLPTIIFDEIDTGVSGEVAEKVGNIIHRMAEGRQVINITHLPQIASKGKNHFLVFKTDEDGSSTTRIKQLSEAERHFEIARMLSGEEITDAALEHARMLLNY